MDGLATMLGAWASFADDVSAYLIILMDIDIYIYICKISYFEVLQTLISRSF